MCQVPKNLTHFKMISVTRDLSARIDKYCGLIFNDNIVCYKVTYMTLRSDR